MPVTGLSGSGSDRGLGERLSPGGSGVPGSGDGGGYLPVCADRERCAGVAPVPGPGPADVRTSFVTGVLTRGWGGAQL